MDINEINDMISDYLEEIGTNLGAGGIVSLFMVAIVLEILFFRTSHTLPWFLQVFLGVIWKLSCIVVVCILIRVVINKLKESSAK